MTNKTNKTREEWLWNVTRAIARKFKSLGFELPETLSITCGYKYDYRGGKSIGWCYNPSASRTGNIEIFVSPNLGDDGKGQTQSALVAATLIHELCHAACYNRDDLKPDTKSKEWTGADPRMGHGPVFKEVATGVGLTGKMTETVAGKELGEWIKARIKQFGEYPHARMKKRRKGSTSRIRKFECPACAERARQVAEETGAKMTSREVTSERTIYRVSLSTAEAGAPICGRCAAQYDSIVPMVLCD